MSPEFCHLATKDADARGGADIVQIAYVGVWETVGAQGIPPSLAGACRIGLWNRRYKFHDMALVEPGEKRAPCLGIGRTATRCIRRRCGIIWTIASIKLA